MRVLGKYAIVLILDGEVFYEDANGSKAVLNSGQIIMVTPELAHAYGSNNGEPWSQTYVVFDGPQFDLLQQSEIIQSRQPFWKLESIPEWNNRLENVIHHSGEVHKGYDLRTIGNFVQLLIDMAVTDAPIESTKHDWLKESIRLLGEPQSSGWMAPQEVAIQVGLSYENFRKLFNERMGKPPSKYQRQRKIDRACAAIYHGSINFKELAEQLEFSDVYHFSKTFRQIKGIPPSTYRRTVRGE